MKTLKLMLLSLSVVFLFASCGSTSSKSDESSDSIKTEETTEENAKETDAEEMSEGEKVDTLKTSQNMNELLNEYEAYTQKYVALIKKAAGGDLSAMADLATMHEEIAQLGNKLENAKGQFTAEQTTRFEKILKEFSDASNEALKEMKK